MEDPIFMSDHTHEIRSLERCIARCTDDRVRWLLDERMKVLRARMAEANGREHYLEQLRQKAFIDIHEP